MPNLIASSKQQRNCRSECQSLISDSGRFKDVCMTEICFIIIAEKI